MGPPAVDLSVPPLARLALGVRPRQARNSRGLASRAGFRLFWTQKVRRGQAGRPVISREFRDLIRKMCRENSGWGAPRIHGELLKLGIDISESSVSKYMLRRRKPPSQTWRTFLENHLAQLVSMDFFTVPTIRFQVLYVFLVLAHDRRRILHFNVTAHPTAEWTGQQLRETFPFDQLLRYLLRDRDAIFGNAFTEQVGDMGIQEELSTPRSLWQRAYVERMIGSIRRECLDHAAPPERGRMCRTNVPPLLGVEICLRPAFPCESANFISKLRITIRCCSCSGFALCSEE
jgi:transposase InsO family protein